MKRTILFLTAVVLGLFVGVFFVPESLTRSVDQATLGALGLSDTTASTPGLPQESGTTAGASEATSAAPVPELPASLRNTDVDGGLLVDSDGQFTPTNDALEMFDYFFTGLGEESQEDVIARIVAEIHKTLEPAAAAQALAFLQNYLDYRQQAGGLSQQAADGDSLLTQFERLRALRRQIFGQEIADQLFGDDEALTQIRLEQQDIAEDSSLSDDERRQRIQELNQQLLDSLPPEAVAARERAQAPAQLLKDEELLRQQGSSAEEVNAMRVERFGEEAAGRLADLDRKREAWQGRIDDYVSQRQAIEDDLSISQAERLSAIAKLRNSNFSGSERLRVDALERIANP
jgi:lipase chaperone LimK